MEKKSDLFAISDVLSSYVKSALLLSENLLEFPYKIIFSLAGFKVFKHP